MDSEHVPPPAPPPTLRTLLSGDTCGLVARHLGLAELAAITVVLLPARPRELFEAIELFAARCLPDAPLWCAAESFSTAAIWSVRVAACDWHPRVFFGGLRAPAYCRVAGSGLCAHGLCQKQELPKQGVLELLEWLARDSPPLLKPPSSDVASAAAAGASGCRPKASSDAAATAGPSTRVLSLECLAWLHGALGRRDTALGAWARAARAGSARAQLDVGVRVASSSLVSGSPVSSSLVSSSLVSGSLVSGSLVSGSLVSGSLVSRSLVSGSLVSGSLVSGSLVSGSLVSGSLVSGSLVSGSLVSGSLVSTAAHTSK
jgi:hypothetical protein